MIGLRMLKRIKENRPEDKGLKLLNFNIFLIAPESTDAEQIADMIQRHIAIQFLQLPKGHSLRTQVETSTAENPNITMAWETVRAEDVQ